MMDQVIAYLCPKIRCQQTWMLIMLHCLDIIYLCQFLHLIQGNNT